MFRSRETMNSWPSFCGGAFDMVGLSVDKTVGVVVGGVVVGGSVW